MVEESVQLPALNQRMYIIDWDRLVEEIRRVDEQIIPDMHEKFKGGSEVKTEFFFDVGSHLGEGGKYGPTFLRITMSSEEEEG